MISSCLMRWKLDHVDGFLTGGMIPSERQRTWKQLSLIEKERKNQRPGEKETDRVEERRGVEVGGDGGRGEEVENSRKVKTHAPRC